VYHKILSEKRIEKRNSVQQFLELEFQKPAEERFVQQQSLSPIEIILINQDQILEFQNLSGYKVLSIDETQGIVNLTSKSNVHSNQPIGLFTIMLHRPKLSAMPVGQLLSNSRKSIVIQNFLNVWRDKVGVNRKVHEIVMDQDAAETEAACIAFNGINLKVYNQFAFFYVQDPTKTTFSFTLIRFDRNHLTKTFVTQTRRLNLDKLYNLSMCLLIDEVNFGRVTKVFGCFFALVCH
jgi:hypothetical protein